MVPPLIPTAHQMPNVSWIWIVEPTRFAMIANAGAVAPVVILAALGSTQELQAAVA